MNPTATAIHSILLVVFVFVSLL